MDRNEIKQKVSWILIDQLGIKEDEIFENASLIWDIGADSLDVVEIIMAVEEEFEIDIWDEDLPRDDDITVAWLIEYAKEHI